MKKNILVFISGVFCTSLMTGHAIAQNVTDLAFTNLTVDALTDWTISDSTAKSNTIDPTSKLAFKEMKANLKATKINSKISNHINNEYKNISNLSLSPSDNLTIAKFKMNEKNFKVVYDKRGNWSYTLLTYHENQMPQNIKLLMNSTYKDFTISLVQEIHEYDITCFMVYLNNKQNFKSVLILNDEIIEVKDYNKRL